MFNSVTAAAYLVKDPEVRNTKSGSKVVNLRAGISSANAKTKCFVDIEFWDKTAEIAEKYLKKGSLIYVEGQIKSRKFTDQSGMEKYTTEVVLQQYNSSLTMLDNKSDSSSNLESPNIENSKSL